MANLLMHTQEQISEYKARERNDSWRNGEDVFWGAYYGDWGQFVNSASVRYNGEIYTILHEISLIHEFKENGACVTLAELKEGNLQELLELPVLPGGISFGDVLKQAKPSDVWGY